jgi:hypothetical protein
MWSRLGRTYWGGVLFGLGLGLFVAKILQDLELWKFALVGFMAIAFVGIGQGIAWGAVRRNLQQEKDQARNQ